MSVTMEDLYSLEMHKHRLSAWAASRAASASPKCRFKVKQGFAILEGAGFDSAFQLVNMQSPKEVDRSHKKWRVAVIKQADKQGLDFTHGIAAKLINCYLKTRFVCGGANEKDIKYLHPPIDALLLDQLKKNNVGGQKKSWKNYADARWSKFSSDTYESAIASIKLVMKDEPLWEIEKYWVGFQDS
tara:strand:+ start:59 stop:616 length:558 start_codon:yes stop_codon:yes gene_type:complete